MAVRIFLPGARAAAAAAAPTEAALPVGRGGAAGSSSSLSEDDVAVIAAWAVSTGSPFMSLSSTCWFLRMRAARLPSYELVSAAALFSLAAFFPLAAFFSLAALSRDRPVLSDLVVRAAVVFTTMVGAG